MAQISQELELK